MTDTEEAASTEAKRCFVVMGFGIKTDYATGRKLDLNKSYKLLIKPAVEGKGLVCVRADEILQSGSIEVPMYQELLKADVVVADLSTANLNAFYELGIRHALRPRSTIVISEDKLPYPFDLNHVKITSYTHLGDAIDYEEVERFRKVLGETLDAVLKDEDPDSPVYTFLHHLVPPSLQEQVVKAAATMENILNQASDISKDTKEDQEKDVITKNNPTLAILTDQGEAALKKRQYSEAKDLFNSALLIGSSNVESKMMANNPYLITRLALATYKAKEPDEITALNKASALLNKLDIDNTNDPEIIALAGSIEKRLYENTGDNKHLNAAVTFYERGYFLRTDRKINLNLAFMFNCRSDSSLDEVKEEQIADLVWASRIRREVVSLCEEDLENIRVLEAKAVNTPMLENEGLLSTRKESEREQKFWALVNKAEAHFGLGDFDEYEKARAEALALEHEDWMMETFDEQVSKLRVLLRKHGSLMNPAWVDKQGDDPISK